MEIKKCKWCNGTGSDLSVSPYCPCPDCEGTGWEGGKAAEEELERQIELAYQQHLANK